MQAIKRTLEITYDILLESLMLAGIVICITLAAVVPCAGIKVISWLLHG